MLRSGTIIADQAVLFDEPAEGPVDDPPPVEHLETNGVRWSNSGGWDWEGELERRAACRASSWRGLNSVSPLLNIVREGQGVLF